MNLNELDNIWQAIYLLRLISQSENYKAAVTPEHFKRVQFLIAATLVVDILALLMYLLWFMGPPDLTDFFISIALSIFGFHSYLVWEIFVANRDVVLGSAHKKTTGTGTVVTTIGQTSVSVQ